MTNTAQPPRTTAIRTAEIIGRRPRSFALAPDAAACKAIADDLGLLALANLRFAGEVRPEGRDDLRLEARLQERVTQPCVISLAPVSSRIDVVVTRQYVTALPTPPAGETEMPEDDETEPMPERIDPAEIMHEALMLALPDYPRAKDEELGEITAVPPGATPLQAEAPPKPFAGLAALKQALEAPDSDQGADKAPADPRTSPPAPKGQNEG